MVRSRKIVDLLCLTIQSVIVSLACLTFSPLLVPVPHRDSGIFLFIGSQLLKGKVLYQQTWDNKQPLLYVLNALGLWLGKGSAWGVWAVEVILFAAALGLLYAVLRKRLSPVHSILIVLAGFLTIYQIMSGNFSEEYSICLQGFLLAVLFLVYMPNRRRFSRPLGALGMGVLAGAAFCLKQTYVDAAFAVGVFLLFLAWLKMDSQYVKHLAWMLGGFLLVNAVVVAYFAAHHALQDYISAAYLINGYYSKQGLVEWLNSLAKTILFDRSYPLLAVMGIVWLAGGILALVKIAPSLIRALYRPLWKWVFASIGTLGLVLFIISDIRGKASGVGLLEWTLLVVSLVFLALSILLFIKKTPAKVLPSASLRETLNSRDWSSANEYTFLFLGFLDLPVVVLTISLSGMNFNHYYISLFPALFLMLSAFVFYARRFPHPLVINCILAAVFVFTCYSPLLEIATRLRTPGVTDDRALTAAYLKANTTPDQKVLVWGWEAGIYYMADRQPPTRYSFQFPAYLNSPYREEVVKTLLFDLKSDPPAYIADTVDSEMPLIQGQSTSACLKANPLDGDSLHALVNYVCSSYQFVESIGSINLYEYKK